MCGGGGRGETIFYTLRSVPRDRRPPRNQCTVLTPTTVCTCQSVLVVHHRGIRYTASVPRTRQLPNGAAHRAHASYSFATERVGSCRRPAGFWIRSRVGTACRRRQQMGTVNSCGVCTDALQCRGTHCTAYTRATVRRRVALHLAPRRIRLAS